MWRVRELRHKGEILAYLQTDRLYAAYAIGDLEPWLFRQCRWWLAEDVSGQAEPAPSWRQGTNRRQGAERRQDVASSSPGQWALILLFAGLEPPALFCLGEPAGVAAALDQAPLPDCVYLTARPPHWPLVEARYCLRFANAMFRMVVEAGSFRPLAQDAVFRLRASDLDALQALYSQGKAGDADGFAPYQVEQGVFYGLAVDGGLVSVAGTHLVAPGYGLAAVGNVFTHPAHRGHGCATICTSAVTAALLAQGLVVVLNVAQANELAVRLYRRLGYRVHCRFLEGIGEVTARSRQVGRGEMTPVNSSVVLR